MASGTRVMKFLPYEDPDVVDFTQGIVKHMNVVSISSRSKCVFSHTWVETNNYLIQHINVTKQSIASGS